VLVVVLLLAVAAIWGLTFVQVKDAVEVYPLFAFLAVRFAIATATLAPVAGRRLRTLGGAGWRAGIVLGGLLAVGYTLQTAGLARTTVSAAGFVTGLYVVLTPVFGLLLFRVRVPLGAWIGVGVATLGLALLSGVEAGSAAGDLLVLGGAAAFALQIVFLERWAPRFDVLALTLAEMVTMFLGFLAVALLLGELAVPRGWTVWGALVVTGVFASALAFLVQTWAQRRTSATRVAVIFAMEPAFAAFFGYTLAGDRLGPVGWIGCGVIMLGIVLAEPAAASALRRLVRPAPGRPGDQPRM
jgi:drug/metabolite transporter (DMT)-like permease